MSEFELLCQQLKKWNSLESACVYWWYKWKIAPKVDPKSLDEKDYRKEINGKRNAKNLEKARLYANTPQAQLKKQRTELRKGLRGEL